VGVFSEHRVYYNVTKPLLDKTGEWAVFYVPTNTV